jgi:hypothetical protein
MNFLAEDSELESLVTAASDGSSRRTDAKFDLIRPGSSKD